MMAGTFFALLLFLVAGMGLILAGFRIRSKALQSRHWPTTAGRILSLDFDDSTDPDDSVTSYQTNIRYAYTVQGVEHVSSRITFGFGASPSRQSQLALYKRFKQAASLIVHYNPARPSEGVLDTSISPSASRLFYGGAVWLTVTIGFFVLEILSERAGATH